MAVFRDHQGPGYEMTWSGSTGGWGHINTFNTEWFESRSNKAMDLRAYYARIASDEKSISQLNHPGKTFGDFADFGFYKTIQLYSCFLLSQLF